MAIGYIFCVVQINKNHVNNYLIDEERVAAIHRNYLVLGDILNPDVFDFRGSPPLCYDDADTTVDTWWLHSHGGQATECGPFHSCRFF